MMFKNIDKEKLMTDVDRIEHIFKSMDFIPEDNFTEGELDLIDSFETQFLRKNWLSDRQLEILEDIYRRANAR